MSYLRYLQRKKHRKQIEVKKRMSTKGQIKRQDRKREEKKRERKETEEKNKRRQEKRRKTRARKGEKEEELKLVTENSSYNLKTKSVVSFINCYCILHNTGTKDDQTTFYRT